MRVNIVKYLTMLIQISLLITLLMDLYRVAGLLIEIAHNCSSFVFLEFIIDDSGSEPDWQCHYMIAFHFHTHT